MPLHKEIVSCKEEEMEPLFGQDIETAHWVGICDEEGILLSEYFDTEDDARLIYDRIDLPEKQP